jgi:hypothetical protein
MYAIYTQASSVEIWLAESVDNIDLALQFLDEFARNELNRETMRSYASPGLLDHDFDGSTLDGSAKESYETVEAIAEMMRAPWWSRTWTVQEYILARKATFHCGSQSLLGAVLIQCVWHVEKHLQSNCDCEFPVDLLTALEKFFEPINSLIRIKLTRMTFVECVGELRFRNASDPRDKLYGILGLGSVDMTTLVRPDYSLPTEKVYEKFVVSLLEHTKVLDVFSYLRPHQRSKSLMPSFVPDWHSDLENKPPWTPRPSLVSAYNTSLDSEVVFKAEAGVLFIRGRIFDTVKRIATAPLLNPTTTCHDPRILDEMLNMARMPPGNVAYGHGDREQFWLAMWADICMDHVHVAAQLDDLQASEHISASYRRMGSVPRQHYENYEQFVRSLADGDMKVYTREINKPGNAEMEAAVSLANASRRGMITDTGCFGLIPMDADVGDVVAVLTGGRVPIILRPEGGYYTVVGDAYVHGIMDGQAMHDVKELKWIELH